MHVFVSLLNKTSETPQWSWKSVESGQWSYAKCQVLNTSESRTKMQLWKMRESSIFNVLEILFPPVKNKLEWISWITFRTRPESVLDVWTTCLSDTLAVSQLRRQWSILLVVVHPRPLTTTSTLFHFFPHLFPPTFLRSNISESDVRFEIGQGTI